MSANPETADAIADDSGSRSFRLHPMIRRSLRDRTIRICGILLLIFAASAILAPVLPIDSPRAQDPYNVRGEPSASNWLGTDELGRDTFSRVIYGGRISLMVGFIAVAISVVVGVPLGLLAGYGGGFIDTAIMRVVDVVMAVPTILLALAIIASLGPGITNAMIAIGFVFAPTYARLVRSEALAAKNQDFVTAARSVGAGPLRLMLVHVFPATWPALIVQISIGVAFAMLVEAGLSFLGLGVQPPTPSWGAMLQGGYPFARTAPWMVLGPGFAIFLAVLAFNVMGDALRDVLDPRLRNREAA